MPSRACRECGEEYRPDATVTECSDCGGVIEWREDPTSSDAPAAQPDGPYRLVYKAEQASEMEPLAKRLGGASIPFAVRPGVGGFRFELWVPVSRVKAARETLGTLIGADTPAENADPAAGPSRCPACDAEITGSGEDCPGCGLAVGLVEASGCPECGAPCDPDVEACPSCGR